ncbi:hypothetical protein [Paractinoplanes rishiriensis]|uniref:Pycsar effector protein domain-containing protein n=1 Tax=Paractinoplanes rishiriensis TaxID=1050105 RepID=A0A919MYK7_9ACTN|nr:hypothetical protein [Actinoplanes rishiriensis]GIE92632.1 hypothetical protein Ari01nite_00970 [Actinoplanes rishiriensis]
MRNEKTREGDALVALHTAALMQQSIGYADAKIATVAGVVCGSAVFLFDRMAGIGDLGRAGPVWLVAGLAMTVLAVAGLSGAVWQLASGLRPRLDKHCSAGRLSITTLASGLEPALTGSGAGSADECWRLARTLARIALTKHERVRQSLLWTALALTGMAGIVLCTSLPPGMAIGAAA